MFFLCCYHHEVNRIRTNMLYFVFFFLKKVENETKNKDIFLLFSISMQKIVLKPHQHFIFSGWNASNEENVLADPAALQL